MSRVYQRDLGEHWERWSYARDARAPWDREAKIDREYEAGKIWTPKELAIFEKRDQPAVRFQLIRRAVNLVCGLEAQTRSDLKALPRTPRAIDTAEAATKLLKYELDERFERNQARCFKDAAIVGVGWHEMGYGDNPAGRRIQNWRVPPDLVYVDPDGTEPDLADFLDVFRAPWMRWEDLARRFPRWRKDIAGIVGAMPARDDRQRLSHSSDYANAHNGEPPRYPAYGNGYNHGQISEGMDYANGIDRKRGLLQPVERWYRDYQIMDYVKFRDGRVAELTEENALELAEAILSGDARMPETDAFCQIRVACFLHDLLLSDAESPYTHEFFPLVPYWAYEDENGLPCGIVRAGRDPQKEYAARRASAMKRNMMPKYAAESRAFKDWSRARRQLAGNESLVELADGGLGAFKELDTAARNQVDIEMMSQAERQVYEAVGITPELMGIAGGAKSGTAIEKLSNQGQTALWGLFENRNWAHQTLGQIGMSLIADTYTEEAAVRVSDSGRGIAFITINQRTEDGIQNDVANEKLDVSLSLDAKQTTNMLAQLETINAFLANADPAIKLAFAPEVARLMALPNAAEAVPKIERLTEALLARIVGPEVSPVPGGPAGPALPGLPSPPPGGALAPASPEPGPQPPVTAA